MCTGARIWCTLFIGVGGRCTDFVYRCSDFGHGGIDSDWGMDVFVFVNMRKAEKRIRREGKNKDRKNR